MKFKLNTINEDMKSKYGFDFNDLMHAAMNKNGDFVLNPPNIKGQIELPNNLWNELYDAMFDTDDEITYKDDEWDDEINNIHKFSKRYKSV